MPFSMQGFDVDDTERSTPCASVEDQRWVQSKAGFASLQVSNLLRRQPRKRALRRVVYHQHVARFLRPLPRRLDVPGDQLLEGHRRIIHQTIATLQLRIAT